jgi:nucleotide-binding universal stress UspA family protein
MASRLLVLYDGSTDARKAVEEALRLAFEAHACLFVLAVRLHDDATTVDAGAHFTQDLIAFAREGKRLGTDVDASYLDAPTPALVQQVLLAHGIDRVLVARPGHGASCATTLLWNALHDDCPVPVTVIG